MTPRKPITPALETRADAEAAMEKLARATHSRTGLQAELDFALTEIRSRFEPQLTAYSKEIASHEDALEAWAKANRAECSPGKSLELLHGTISFRTGMPSLKLIGRINWDTVLENLYLLKLTTYIRSEMTVAKDKLLADSDKLGEQLEAIGVKVSQRETINIEPKVEDPA